jgi:hypothetical protein
MAPTDVGGYVILNGAERLSPLFMKVQMICFACKKGLCVWTPFFRLAFER